MTSAPKSDSTVAAAGAAMKLAQSRTFSPSKMPFSIVTPLPCDLLLLFPRDGITAAIDPDERHLAQVGQGMQRRFPSSAMSLRRGTAHGRCYCPLRPEPGPTAGHEASVTPCSWPPAPRSPTRLGQAA